MSSNCLKCLQGCAHSFQIPDTKVRIIHRLLVSIEIQHTWHTVIVRPSLSSDVSDSIVSFKPCLNSDAISTATLQAELTSSLLTPAGGGNITFMCSRCGEHSPSPQGPTAASVRWLSVPTWVLSPPTGYFTAQPELWPHPLHPLTFHCWRTGGNTFHHSLDHMTWWGFMTSLMLGECMNQYPFTDPWIIKSIALAVSQLLFSNVHIHRKSTPIFSTRAGASASYLLLSLQYIPDGNSTFLFIPLVNNCFVDSAQLCNY